MAVTTITYADTAAATATAVDSLTTLAYASTTQVDNTSTNYVDVLVGGYLVGGAGAAGETIDIYVIATYSDTNTDVGGAIQSPGAISEAGEVLTQGAGAGEFLVENLTFLTSVMADHTATEEYHWGPVSIAAAFGGTMPRKWTLVFYNGTGATLGSGTTVDYTGVTYTTA